MLNGKLFFFASDGVHGFEPFVSDGTAAGTTLVKDINPGGASSIGSVFFFFFFGSTPATVFNGVVYFPATDGASGQELWRSDGTTAGTSGVKDIDPGPADGLGLFPSIVPFHGQLYFGANDGSTNHGNELWQSNGTGAGTQLI